MEINLHLQDEFMKSVSLERRSAITAIRRRVTGNVIWTPALIRYVAKGLELLDEHDYEKCTWLHNLYDLEPLKEK